MSSSADRKPSGRGRARGRGRPPGRPAKRGKKKTVNSRTDNDFNNENESGSECIANEILDTFSPKFTESIDVELTPPHTISFVSPSSKLMHKNEPLSWDYRVNLIGEKVINPRIHCCEKCKLPILVYGRMIPCKHIFCYSCGKQSDTSCPRCSDKVARVEKTGLGTVFMCQTESCKRTYLSQRDLEAHIQHRHLRRLVASVSMNATSGAIASSNSLTNTSSQSHSTSIQSSNARNMSYNSNSYQSPIPVVSSRSNLITVPIQEEVSGINQMPQTVNTQNSMIVTNQPQVSNYVTPQTQYAHHPPHMQWPPMTNANAFPYGRPPWPPMAHPYNNPYNRPYYPHQ